MKPPTPPRVADATEYWTSPPPAPSARLGYWQDRIAAGWRPNKRVRALGYHDSADFYGVYIWEWINVLRPLLDPRPVLSVEAE